MENIRSKPTNKKVVFLIIIGIIILSGVRINPNIKIESSVFQNFFITFISIIIEALPFIIVGALMAALIQVFVSEELITKILPKNRFIRYISAALLGLIFPICECAIVPITKKLMKKGVPTGSAITFMLAVPIINPVVIMSTYYAFYSRPIMALLRCIFGFIIAITVGFLIDCDHEKNEELFLNKEEFIESKGCLCGCGFESTYRSSKVEKTLDHTIKEFKDVSKYLILGAFISSIFQVTISRNFMNYVGSNSIYSVLIMMGLAFILSICSEADAFIGRTFLGSFTIGSVAAFLILGPMLDIKNTFMLVGNFKRKLVIEIIIYVVVFSFLAGCFINFMSKVGVI